MADPKPRLVVTVTTTSRQEFYLTPEQVEAYRAGTLTAEDVMADQAPDIDATLIEDIDNSDVLQFGERGI